MNIGHSAVNARIAICILSMVMPWILIIFSGTKLTSLSEYFYTPLGPFFICVLSLVSYLLFTLPKWIPSAILLFIVLMFPNRDYPLIHNSAAILFFISAALAILFDKKHVWMGWMMILFSPIVLFDLFVVEFIMIMIISSYHLTILSNIKKILKRRDKI